MPLEAKRRDAIMAQVSVKEKGVLEQSSQAKVPRQVWFAVAMGVLLLVMLLGVAFGLAPQKPAPPKSAQGIAPPATPTPASPTITPRPTETRPLPSPTATPTEVPPTATPSLTPTARPTASPTLTLAPSHTPSPLPTASPTRGVERAWPRQDHLWLRRPISPDGVDTVARFYPYASRADGTYPIHHGVEFVNPMGTPILAVAAGHIIVAGDDQREVYGARTNFYGLLVIQELDERLDGAPVYVLYGHLSKVAVTPGQNVQPGEVIGEVGMTGVAEGPHLHFEVRIGQNQYSATVNPELWFAPKEGRGILAGTVETLEGQRVPEVRVVLSRAADPDRPVYTLMTYPSKEVNPDPSWGENVAIGDLEAGDWVVRVYRGQRLYTETVKVEPGKTAWFTIRVPE